MINSPDAKKFVVERRFRIIANKLHKCEHLLVLLGDCGDDLAQHDNTVSVHESNTGQTLAVLEGVAHQGLLGRKRALSHLVGLQGVGVLHLLTTGLLTHLPLHGSDTAGGATATDEADGRVTALDLTGDVQDLDLSVELGSLQENWGATIVGMLVCVCRKLYNTRSKI